MTDTESTESIKDDVPDDDTNYVPSSQDDDHKAKQRKQTRSLGVDVKTSIKWFDAGVRSAGGSLYCASSFEL